MVRNGFVIRVPQSLFLGGVVLGETFIFVKVIKEQKTFATVDIRIFKQ